MSLSVGSDHKISTTNYYSSVKTSWITSTGLYNVFISSTKFNDCYKISLKLNYIKYCFNIIKLWYLSKIILNLRKYCKFNNDIIYKIKLLLFLHEDI